MRGCVGIIVVGIALAGPGAARSLAEERHTAPVSGDPATHAPAVVGPVDTARARALFERFRSLEGEWAGRSTRGWEDSVSWRVIAGGSIVMSTSFEAHPGETMVTLFGLDVGRLALTHYCVAGNQPRLVATECTPDGREVTFTFRDGGNLSSRDQGHMDKAVFRFHDDGTMTSRWTWYQKGQERWMEEIAYRRLN